MKLNHSSILFTNQLLAAICMTFIVLRKWRQVFFNPDSGFEQGEKNYLFPIAARLGILVNIT